MSKTVQFQACLMYSPEGLLCCSCGVCLMPSPEQRRKIRSHSELMSMPYDVVKTDCSRGAKHGETQWQYDHWKAKDAQRHVTRKKHDSILLRWQNDERYRTQTVHGWTEEALSLPGFHRICGHIVCCNIQRAFKIRKQFYAGNRRWTTTRANDTSRILSTSSSHSCSHQK